MKKGLLSNVYRPVYDCTGGGVTSRVSHVIVVWPDMPDDCKVFEPTDNVPLVKLVPHRSYGYTVQPMETPINKSGPMFGGNFVYSSDSRFPSDHPIHVFDRFE